MLIALSTLAVFFRTVARPRGRAPGLTTVHCRARIDIWFGFSRNRPEMGHNLTLAVQVFGDIEGFRVGTEGW